MKLVKYIFFLLLVAIIGGAVYFGTQDGSFDTSVSRNMNVPASLVYENVSDLKNWEAWEPWSEEDPNMVITYADETKDENGSYSWTSDVMGNGMMKTTEVSQGEKINQTIQFTTPIGEINNDVYWTFTSSEKGSTEVTWGMKGERSFLEKVYETFQKEDTDSQLRQMFSRGLEGLETAVKSEMEAYEISVNGMREYGGGYYMYTTAASKQSDLSTKMGPMMGKVMAFMQQNKVQAAGMPFTIYNEIDGLNNTVIFSTAFPVKERIIVTEGDILCGYMEPLTAIKTTLSGNYTYLSEAYKKTQEYIKDNGYILDTSKKMFEVYTNNPDILVNPAQWETQVYIPVLKPIEQ